MRLFIRRERDHIVRVDLERLGYVLDYWLVYRVDQLTASVAPAQRLRASTRGSSRRLHELRARERALRALG